MTKRKASDINFCPVATASEREEIGVFYEDGRIDILPPGSPGNPTPWDMFRPSIHEKAFNQSPHLLN